MIVLDTNVISEPMKRRRDPAVKAWLDRQAADSLYLTATSLAELLLGIEILPDGKRKNDFQEALSKFIAEHFGSRILAFDGPAAKAYAGLIARARAKGRTISVSDGQIGAIATVRGFIVATRDTSPFMAAGVAVVDPWQKQV